MIYFSGAAVPIIEDIQKIKFLDEKNDFLRNELLNLYSKSLKEKEIQSIIIKSHQDLVKRINDNSNLKIIIGKKNYEEIKDILVDLLSELSDKDQKRKIESLEKKVINNMDENAYSELVKLKSQINRD